MTVRSSRQGAQSRAATTQLWQREHVLQGNTIFAASGKSIGLEQPTLQGKGRRLTMSN